MRRAGLMVKPVYRKREGEALQMACGICACSIRASPRFPVRAALISAGAE